MFSLFQLGIALGFLLPPLMVHNSDNLRDISSSLSRMFYGFAIFSTVIFILIFFCKYAVDTILKVVVMMRCFHKRYVVECLSYLCIAVVTASPPLPPSLAQANQRSANNNISDPRNFIKSLWRLIGNYGFVLLLLSYGMNVGSFYAISTLLNEFILKYFPVSIHKQKVLLP